MAEKEPFGKKVKKYKVWPTLLSGKGQILREIKLTTTANEANNSGITSAINVGIGFGVYKQQVGTELQFKSLRAGSNITISAIPGGDTIIISSTATGEVNTAINIGGGEGVFAQKVGVDLEFKSLIGGTNINISSTSDEVTLSTTAEANTASNVGTGAGVFKQKTGVDFEFRRINSNDFSVTENASDITIDAAVPMITNQASVTPAAGMQVLLEDSGTLKRADVSSFVYGRIPVVQSYAVTPVNLSLITGDYFYFIGVDSSIGPVTVNLPTASTGKYSFMIKDIGCSSYTNNITINTSGGENIIETTTTNSSVTLGADGGALQFISDGSGNWWLH